MAEFLRLLSNFSMFGVNYKIVYMMIVVGFEPKNAKDLENMIHNDVSFQALYYKNITLAGNLC